MGNDTHGPVIGIGMGSFVAKDLCDVLPSRRAILPTVREAMGADDIYVGQANHQHRQPINRGASPSLEGQDGTRRNAPPSTATTRDTQV